jgi:hypothetical protein
MENKTLNTQIEQALNSLDGIKRAPANPFLLTRVMEKLHEPAPRLLKPRLIWQVAVGLLLILCLNIGAGIYVSQKQGQAAATGQEGYFTNQIYTY